MREIRFRAWDAHENKMIVIPDEIPIYYENENGLHAGYFKDNGDWNSLVLMQYTGLKDKNGVEIYEGDILKIYVGGYKQDKPYLVKDIRKFYLQNNRDDQYLCINQSESEIIGNIHSNPHMPPPPIVLFTPEDHEILKSIKKNAIPPKDKTAIPH